jgi:hypothetical protein
MRPPRRPSAAAAVALPPLTRSVLHHEHVARAQVAVVGEALLGVEAVRRGRTVAVDPRSRGGRSDPRDAGLRTPVVPGLEVVGRHRERGWGDETPRGTVGGDARVGVRRVRIAQGTGEQQDVTRLDGEGEAGHGGGR